MKLWVKRPRCLYKMNAGLYTLRDQNGAEQVVVYQTAFISEMKCYMGCSCITFKTLCVSSTFLNFFLQNLQNSYNCSIQICLLKYNLNVKQFGSQMRPHVLWGLILIKIVYRGYQQSSGFADRGAKGVGQRVKCNMGFSF